MTKYEELRMSLERCGVNQCPKCDGTGTINEFKWVERDDYRGKDGKPIRTEVVSMTLCNCHKDKIFDKYNAKNGMKPEEREHTFENAIIDSGNHKHFMLGKMFINNIDQHLEEGKWLYIYADPVEAKNQGKSAFGTGKSYLTHCIGNFLSEKRYRTIYVTEDDLLGEFKKTYKKHADETESQVMWRFENVPILMIDDMFKSKITDWMEDKLFHLLNNRMNRGKVTVMNSNYSIDRIEDVMLKNGGAIASRIRGRAMLINMIDRDRRKG